MRSENQKTRERAAEQAKMLENNYRRAIDEHDQKTAEATDEIRRASGESVERARQDARSDVEREKTRNYDRYGKAAAENAQSIKRTDETMEELKKDYDYRLARQKPHAPPSEENEHITHAVDTQNQSHEAETRQLRSDLKNLAETQKDYVKGRSEGITDARHELEHDAKMNLEMQRKTYEDQISKAKRDNEVIARNGNDRLTEGLHERDVKTEALLRQANEERAGEQKFNAQNFSRFIESQKALQAKSQKSQEAQFEEQAKVSAQSRSNALSHQAEAYHSQLADIRAQDEEKINRLQNKINVQRTSTDGNEVSPAYAEAVRQNLTKEYEKTHQANVARMQSQTDEMRDEYVRRFNEVAAEKQQRITELNSQHQTENQRERTAFNDHVMDLEQTNQLEKRQNSSQLDRQLASANRNHSQLLERQRQSYEMAMAQTKEEAQQRINATTQKAEFESKMASRNFAQHENELIREYEKKLGDQKVLYEDQIDQLKTQLSLTNHDAERRGKQMLDDQARGYEQRLQALEFQSKERERMISENYQDQMEKMKRSYALQQKKG
jgi:hypothetical protein